jgi:hypothetical protein
MKIQNAKGKNKHHLPQYYCEDNDRIHADRSDRIAITAMLWYNISLRCTAAAISGSGCSFSTIP